MGLNKKHLISKEIRCPSCEAKQPQDKCDLKTDGEFIIKICNNCNKTLVITYDTRNPDNFRENKYRIEVAPERFHTSYENKISCPHCGKNHSQLKEELKKENTINYKCSKCNKELTVYRCEKHPPAKPMDDLVCPFCRALHPYQRHFPKELVWNWQVVKCPSCKKEFTNYNEGSSYKYVIGKYVIGKYVPDYHLAHDLHCPNCDKRHLQIEPELKIDGQSRIFECTKCKSRIAVTFYKDFAEDLYEVFEHLVLKKIKKQSPAQKTAGQ